MIIENIEIYDGDLIHKRFAYDVFRDQISPYGNIVAFRAPMSVKENLIDQEDVLQNDFIESEDAINFCWEIPGLDRLGAVFFQRLFNTQIANILSLKYIKKPIEVAGDDLMVHDQFVDISGDTHERGKCSVSITYSKDNIALGHTGININAGKKAPNFAYSTDLTNEQAQEFMQDIINVFYSIVTDSYIATSKINIW